MSYDIRTVKNIEGLIGYFSQNLGWDIDIDAFDTIEDITYDFSAEEIGLKEESFAKISSLRQLQPLVDGQQWGIFCVEFDSNKFEASALKKILSGLVPRKRSSVDHAVWCQQDLLFICNWGTDNNSTLGVAHFEDREGGLPQIKMISCAPALEDFTQISNFENQLSKLSWPRDTRNIDAWREMWSSAFTTGYKENIEQTSQLTVRLAAEAQNIRNRILEIMDVETSNGYVHLLYEKFRNTLIHDMTEVQFADMYAQTVVYGLFSARCMDESQDDFSAAEAVNCIPNTNPFLKSLMEDCLGAGAKGRLSFDELEIGNVVDLLLHTKTNAIIQDFNRQTGGGKEDPVIHFYEEFLTAYDREQRVQRGVYYTPQPVVDFMVRAVDDILKNEFGYEDGLATTETKKIKVMAKSERKVNGTYKDVEKTIEVPAVQVLDPATGTGTFIRQVILQIYENFQKKHNGQPKDIIASEWNKYVDEHLLPRVNAFELMMAPYAVAHMKLAMVLRDTGYDFKGKHRLNLFLTNSLEEPGDTSDQISLFEEDPLATESVEANIVKKNKGVNILIGNPPYSVESSNKNAWIQSLMEDYKREPGGLKKLDERNPKPINDDYVKFIRYAENMISKSSNGILAYINPHGFIANPVFRGMRWKLLQSFDTIYIIDLHGNSHRQETCPDGSKDENVFDIQQGVCICIFVKNTANSNDKCKVYHTDVFGMRQNKYTKLSSCGLFDLTFEEVSPEGPEYYLKQVDYAGKALYERGISVNSLFISGAAGIVTARDSFTIDYSKDAIRERINEFRKLDIDTARNTFSLGKDGAEWNVANAIEDVNQNAVSNNAIDEKNVVPLNYRIFDTRFMVYTGTACGLMARPRYEIAKQFFLGPNIGLATGRTNKSPSCDHFYAVKNMIEMKCAERSTGSIVYPLYIFNEGVDGIEKTLNLDLEIVNQFSECVGLSFKEFEQSTDESFNERDLFNYIYAMLYSREYRETFQDFLKADFPRVPFIKDALKFKELASFGNRLAEIHTFEKVKSFDDIQFVDNGREVAKVSYSDGKVFINKKSYFENISCDEWEFLIGGYPPLKYWYKDRHGLLSDDDINHYIEMVCVIRETIAIMEKIDISEMEF